MRRLARRNRVARIAADKVTVIANGVDAARFTVGGRKDPALSGSLGLDGARVIGYIGSFYGYEGLALLLKALPTMLQHMPAIRVLLVAAGTKNTRSGARRKKREWMTRSYSPAGCPTIAFRIITTSSTSSCTRERALE